MPLRVSLPISMLNDVGVMEHYWHSRMRVYPQDITAFATIQSAAVPNTFGDWVKIVPLNTIPFNFDIIGFVIEKVSDPTRYHIQLGANTIDAEPGTNMEIGERRTRIAETPIKTANELLHLKAKEVLANNTVWARMKTEAGGSEELEISIVLGRHLSITREAAHYDAFPW